MGAQDEGKELDDEDLVVKADVLVVAEQIFIQVLCKRLRVLENLDGRKFGCGRRGFGMCPLDLRYG